MKIYEPFDNKNAGHNDRYRTARSIFVCLFSSEYRGAAAIDGWTDGFIRHKCITHAHCVPNNSNNNVCSWRVCRVAVQHGPCDTRPNRALHEGGYYVKYIVIVIVVAVITVVRSVVVARLTLFLLIIYHSTACPGRVVRVSNRWEHRRRKNVKNRNFLNVTRYFHAGFIKFSSRFSRRLSNGTLNFQRPIIKTSKIRYPTRYPALISRFISRSPSGLSNVLSLCNRYGFEIGEIRTKPDAFRSTRAFIFVQNRTRVLISVFLLFTYGRLYSHTTVL